MKSICQFCSVGCKCKWTIVIVKRRLQRRHRRQRQRCWPFQRPFCAMQWHTMAPFYRQAALFCPGPPPTDGSTVRHCARVSNTLEYSRRTGAATVIYAKVAAERFSFLRPGQCCCCFTGRGRRSRRTSSWRPACTKAPQQFREEQSWEKLTQFLCFTEWGLPTHVQLWLWDFWNYCAFLYINE